MNETANNIMLDLETLSSAPDACIVAIGATAFSIDGSPAAGSVRFYVVVDPKSAQQAGGTIDARTVAWWTQQSDAARSIFSFPRPLPITAALEAFAEFCARFNRPKIWGNGAGFDNVVLRSAYERLNITTPWEWRDDRCYRTLKNMHPDIQFDRSGVAHDALDDAISQARHAERIFSALAKACGEQENEKLLPPNKIF